MDILSDEEHSISGMDRAAGAKKGLRGGDPSLGVQIEGEEHCRGTRGFL